MASHRIWDESQFRISMTSAASNGASARAGQIGPFGRDWRLGSNLVFSPTGAAATGSSAATYRSIQLVNGGTAGTGTTVIGQLDLVTSLAQFGTRAFATVQTSATVGAGEVVYLKQTTVGSNDHANLVMPISDINGVAQFIG